MMKAYERTRGGAASSFVGGEGDGLWVGLGYTEAGFWSAEAHPPDDACEGCETLDVVVTGFDGKRRSFPVIGTADRRRLERAPPVALTWWRGFAAVGRRELRVGVARRGDARELTVPARHRETVPPSQSNTDSTPP
jgi:hypothetical protein